MWRLVTLLILAQVYTMTNNSDAQNLITTASGLQYIEQAVGSGKAAEVGDNVVVHYTGWLYSNGERSDKFDSSVDRGQTFSFPLGAGHVIKGWDEGVAGMNKGSKRTLFIPPILGYGARGAGDVIPPNSTLMFEIELIEIQ